MIRRQLRKWRNKSFSKIVERELLATNNHKVLDVGCSSKQRVTLERVMLDIHLCELRKQQGKLVCADARALPFRDGSFDTILSTEVLEHIPQPEHALSEFRRVANECVLSVPYEPFYRFFRALGGRFRDTPGHINHWTRYSFRRFVGTHFNVKHTTTVLPLVVVRASR